MAFADDLLQICYRGKSVFSSSVNTGHFYIIKGLSKILGYPWGVGASRWLTLQTVLFSGLWKKSHQCGKFIVTYSYFCFNTSQTSLLIYYYPLLCYFLYSIKISGWHPHNLKLDVGGHHLKIGRGAFLWWTYPAIVDWRWGPCSSCNFLYMCNMLWWWYSGKFSFKKLSYL